MKLKELHVATARKPLIHENQPAAQYLRKTQPYMMQFMTVSLPHNARSLKSPTGNEVNGKFHIPANDTNAFANGVPALAVVLFT